MQDREDIEKILQEFSVSPSIDSSSVLRHNSSPLIFSAPAAKSLPSYKSVKKQIFKRFENEEYDLLENDFRSYGLTQEYINSFFCSEEGSSVLYSAVVGTSDEKFLEFLLKKVPKDVLSKALNKNNFFILKAFLSEQVGLEKMEIYDDFFKEDQTKMFKLLLSIDSEMVQKFITEKISEGYITEKHT